MSHEDDLLIRTSERTDRCAILDVVGTAFAGEGHDEQGEIDIVESIWSLDAAVEGLDLVAARSDQIVGHVLGSWGHLIENPEVGVAPLAVRPSNQGMGVGSALMREIIRRADLAQLPLLVLLGDPGYYRRFGFEPAGSFGVWYSPVGRGNPHLMIRKLAAFSGCLGGEYRYAWEL